MDGKRQAVVAGAGPVGALTAIFLARQGYIVNVYEKRSLPRHMPPSSDSKAYMLNLNARAFAAFKAAEISIDEPVKRCNGRAEFQFRDGKGRAIGGLSEPVSLENPMRIRVYRDEISRHLIEEAQRLHREAITFHFQASVTAVNFHKQVATVADSREVPYDVLIGADGAGSVVRSQLATLMPPGFITRRTNTAVYATGPLHIENPESFPQHTFTTFDQFEAGAVMVYGRGNGDYRIGLFLDDKGAARLKKGDNAWLQKLLDKSMPMLLQDARKSAKLLAAHPPDFSPISDWTKLSQIHGPRVALVGDAAHTMTPMLGQGCNSGLEDAHILSKILASTADLDQALEKYTEERLPDVRALVEVNEVVARLRFQPGGVRMALSKKVPSLVDPPALFRALTTHFPFRKVLPAAYFDVATASALLAIAIGITYYSLREA